MTILYYIFNTILSVLLAPINLIVQNNLPNIENALSGAVAMFDKIEEVIFFCLSYTGIYDWIIHFVCEATVALLVITLACRPLKLALKWIKGFI